MTGSLPRLSSLACAMLLLSACSRGPLPDLGFGSKGESAGGESSSASSGSGSDSEPTVSSSTDPSGEGEAEGEAEGEGEGEGSSSGPGSEGEGSAEGSDSAPSTSEGGENSGDPTANTMGGSEEWGDEWGTPPDVTNEPCDALAQDCFPTHKCVPFTSDPNSGFWDANKCMPILGEKNWGEPCTMTNPHEAQDDCGGDGFCWNLEWVEGQLHGICVPFCVGSPQDLMCPAGWGCLFTGAIALCARQCNPLLQDCPQAYGCYWTGGAFDCQINGTPAPAGQACDMNNDCLPGNACVEKSAVPGCQGNDPNCCTPWCDLDQPDPCGAPLSCLPFFGEGEAPEQFANVGVCLLP